MWYASLFLLLKIFLPVDFIFGSFFYISYDRWYEAFSLSFIQTNIVKFLGGNFVNNYYLKFSGNSWIPRTWLFLMFTPPNYPFDRCPSLCISWHPAINISPVFLINNRDFNLSTVLLFLSNHDDVTIHPFKGTLWPLIYFASVTWGRKYPIGKICHR